MIRCQKGRGITHAFSWVRAGYHPGRAKRGEELNALEGQCDFSPKKRVGGSSSISGRGNPGTGTVRNSPQKVLELSRFFGYNRVTKRTFC